MSDPDLPFSFGKVKPCTEQQLASEVSHVYVSCTLANVGTFYFAHWPNFIGTPTDDVCFSVEYQENPQVEAVAINTSVFLLKTKWQGLFLLDKVWNNADFQLIQDEDVPRMITFCPFAAAIDSRMIEAEENSIDLPFPKPTIEVAARYLYGQSLEMDFDEAAHLLVMAQMYDLPEL